MSYLALTVYELIGAGGIALILFIYFDDKNNPTKPPL